MLFSLTLCFHWVLRTDPSEGARLVEQQRAVGLQLLPFPVLKYTCGHRHHLLAQRFDHRALVEVILLHKG